MSRTEVLMKKLNKEAKKLCDEILSTNRFENKMTSDLSNCVSCQENENLRNIVQDWHTINRETFKNNEDFVYNIQKTLIEPLKQLQNCYGDIRAEVKKYEQIQQDCNKYCQKVQKYSEKEKTSQNLVKLIEAKKNLSSAEEDLKTQLSILQREIPLFTELRVDFFQPCLASLIRSEALFWGDNVKAFANQSCTDESQTKFNLTQYSKDQRDRLSQISSLSIVADE